MQQLAEFSFCAKALTIRNSREGRRNRGTVVDYRLDRRSITVAISTRLQCKGTSSTSPQ
jgi:hypothetical protein